MSKRFDRQKWNDILRLLKLAGYERIDTTTDEYVEFENELWEEDYSEGTL